MNKLKKIVNKISHLKSVFTPADKYNDLVDNLNELTTVVDELAANSGGGNSTDLFTDTTANQFVKTNSTNDGLVTANLFGNTSANNLVKTNALNDGLVNMNLFTNTAGNLGVKMNSSNTGFETCYIRHKSFNTNPISIVKIGFPATYDDVAGRSNIIAIGVNNEFGDVLTPLSTSASDVISINSDIICTSGVISIGNYTHNYFITHGAKINVNSLNPLYDNLSTSFKNICRGLNNATDSAKTVTITDNQATQFGSMTIEEGIGNGTEYEFIVDNSLATGTNTVTLVFTDAMFVVPTPADLVVAAGKVAKFSLIIINNTKAIINKIF